ncbi:hypothetical protein [Phenylobacterium sp.]|uniref:hypothetical protein n=1 Tax=Phenylobacterium sp. TaxID=1871053 RepID=UPI002FC6501D
MIRIPFFGRRFTAKEWAERTCALAAPTQVVGHVRAARRKAVTNGLLASVSPETRQRVEAKLAEAERAR